MKFLFIFSFLLLTMPVYSNSCNFDTISGECHFSDAKINRPTCILPLTVRKSGHKFIHSSLHIQRFDRPPNQKGRHYLVYELINNNTEMLITNTCFPKQGGGSGADIICESGFKAIVKSKPFSCS